MKKIISPITILFLLSFLLSATSFAQDTGHLTFKGHPIDGTITSFGQALLKDGFTYDAGSSNDSYKTYNGTFMGIESDVTVYYSPSNLVYKVVAFQEYSSWYTLVASYDKAVESFTKKYSKPNDQYRFFSSPYYEGDGYEMSALRQDKCHFSTFWFTDEGSIAIMLMHYYGNVGAVVISYEDKINLEKTKTERDKQILEDI